MLKTNYLENFVRHYVLWWALFAIDVRFDYEQ